MNPSVHDGPTTDESDWCSTYAVTAVLVFAIHVLFLKQILTRKPSRRNLTVDYNLIVQRKQYHLVIGALLNHGPSKPPYQNSIREREASSRSWCSSLMLNNFVFLQTQNPFGPGKMLSGLPLLFCNAYLLWSCRALEVIHGSGMGYARVLWALTSSALCLDLVFTRCVLCMLREMNDVTSLPYAMGASYWTANENATRPIIREVERVLVSRRIGGVTMTASAVLIVFGDQFNVSVPIIPGLLTTHFFVLGILLALSHPSHPVGGVAFGTLAGFLWTSGWTVFLAESYWSTGSLCLCLGLSMVSLKTIGSPYLPCVDRVPWDSSGQLHSDEGAFDRLQLVQESNDDRNQGYPDDVNSSEDSLLAEEETGVELPISVGITHVQNGTRNPYGTSINDDEDTPSIPEESESLIASRMPDAVFMRARRTLQTSQQL